MRTLTTGGPSGVLAPGWRAQPGYKGGACPNAMWVGKKPATQKAIDRVKKLGHTPDPLTLVGTEDIAWDAEQYADEKDEIAALPAGESVPRPGGEGSWTYQSQHIDDDIDKVVTGRKPTWVFMLDGSVVKVREAQGPIAVEKVNKGDGVIDNHEVGVDVVWDESAKLWREA